MKIKITTIFRDRLSEQVEFIAKDKPTAARNFKTDILNRIKEIPKSPYSYRRSIFFNRADVRDLIFKGYIVVFKVDESNQTIEIFGFCKWQENPSK
jgi:plasmid stabilization system protein ParE